LNTSQSGESGGKR